MSIWTHVLQLDDYPPYSDNESVIFETQNNRNLRCSHGYTSYVTHTDLITWVSNCFWEMLLSEFLQAESIIPCPRTTICNNCEQNNMFGDIFNAGDNVGDQEDYGFRGSFFEITPTVIYEYTENLLKNMQLENLRPMRNVDNNEKKLIKYIRKCLLMEKNIRKGIR